MPSPETRHTNGLIGDLVTGFVGAIVAGFFFTTFGVSVGGGLLGSLVVATIGVIVLLVRRVKRMWHPP
jgi:uncharacterized membrane protein YeaQ/YmgE (transglycosylase-associated protein family)